MIANADKDILDPDFCDPEAREAQIAAKALFDAMDDDHFDLDLAAIDRLNAPPMG